MGRLYLSVILVCLLLVGQLQATPIGRERAQRIAAAKLATLVRTRGPQPTMRLVLEGHATRGGESTYYVFTPENQSGYVVVAGDDLWPEVLGYSGESNFSAAAVPVQLQEWLQDYSLQIDRARRGQGRPTTSYSSTRSGHSYPRTEPLLGETKWDQEHPYNDLLYISGVGYPTGCVATATAQIMYQYRYPSRARRAMVDYVVAGKSSSGELGRVPFDWVNMLPIYRGAESRKQQEAVAQLMYQVGIGCHMLYGRKESSSWPEDAKHALATYMDYSPQMLVKYRAFYSLPEWTALLQQELEARQPILYCGQKPRNGGGHAFVCDGYDGNGYYHFNWGWSGISNGYYLLSDMEPVDQGTGAGAGQGGYRNEQTILVGAVPNTPDYALEYAPELMGDVLNVESVSGLVARVSVQAFNVCVGKKRARLGFRIVEKKQNAPVDVLEGDLLSFPEVLGGWDTSRNDPKSVCTYDFSARPDGTYLLYPLYQFEGSSEWQSLRMPCSSARYIVVEKASGALQTSYDAAWKSTIEATLTKTSFRAKGPDMVIITFTNRSERTYVGPLCFMFSVNNKSTVTGSEKNKLIGQDVVLEPGESFDYSYAWQSPHQVYLSANAKYLKAVAAPWNISDPANPDYVAVAIQAIALDNAPSAPLVAPSLSLKPLKAIYSPGESVQYVFSLDQSPENDFQGWIALEVKAHNAEQALIHQLPVELTKGQHKEVTYTATYDLEGSYDAKVFLGVLGDVDASKNNAQNWQEQVSAQQRFEVLQPPAPQPKEATLQVTVTPVGSGTVVVSSPDGSWHYAQGVRIPVGTTLRVEAQPEAGYTCKRLQVGAQSVAGALLEGYEVVAEGPLAVIAEFEVPPAPQPKEATLQVTVTPAGSGTVVVSSPDGSRHYAQGARIPVGTTLRVEAQPEAGYTCKRLQVGAQSVAGALLEGYEVVAEGPLAVIAEFEVPPAPQPKEATLQVTVTPAGSGTVVVSSPDGSRRYAPGARIPVGTTLRVGAQPEAGYTCKRLQVGVQSVAGALLEAYEVLAEGPLAVTAEFEKEVQSPVMPSAYCGVQIGPNPTDGALYVVGLEEVRELRLYDLLGHCQGSWLVAGQRTKTLDLSQLPSGVYVLRLWGPAGVRVLRVVKSH